ncbi:lipocalin family protein [Echinicola sp. CAU 1574]|uniref:Lipocalin family protein n=1 Tax=Echinicola arenosa TaxID=2774144 RepID=A0ABR9AM90_9BACT|nr:lipocalin family protein [Echinicola arenosa]MBD8489820.1 lipocalin family protein [Echinicola arenosa]
MKMLTLFLSVLLSISSCNSNGQIDNEVSIIGTWQLIERYTSDVGQGKWSPINDGYTYSFKNDGTFVSNKYSECGYGTYILSANSLTLIFGCEEFTTGIETPKGTFVEKLEFENSLMILVPDYLNCVEGCGDKFKKISSE